MTLPRLVLPGLLLVLTRSLLAQSAIPLAIPAQLTAAEDPAKHWRDSAAVLSSLLDNARKDRDALQANLQLASNLIPTPNDINDVQVLTSENDALFRVTLPRPGRVRVIVSGPNNFSASQESQLFGTALAVRVSGLNFLPGGARYTAKVVLLKNAAGWPDAAIAKQGADPDLAGYMPQLRFAVAAPTFTPILSDVRQTSNTGSSATIHFRSSVPSLVHVAAQALATDGTPVDDPIDAGDVFKQDDLGRVFGSPLRTEGTIEVKSLKPGIKYLFRLTAMGEGGKISDAADRASVIPGGTTLGPPRFAGPIDIRFDIVKGFLVKWDAGVKPVSASIRVTFLPDDGVAVPLPAHSVTPTSNSVEVVLPPDDFLAAGLSSKSISKPPVVTITMEHPELAKPLSLDFTIAVQSPPKDQLPQGASKEVRKVSDAIVKAGGDLNWKDLAMSTLKILAPVVVSAIP